MPAPLVCNSRSVADALTDTISFAGAYVFARSLAVALIHSGTHAVANAQSFSDPEAVSETQAVSDPKTVSDAEA